MRILMVHGRGQGGRPADELERVWIKTLRDGFDAAARPWPGAVKIDFPYYGDTLDRLCAQASLPTPEGILAKGPGQNRPFEEFMQSALGEMKDRGSITDAEVRAAMDPSLSQEKGVQNWGWVQAIVRVIDQRLTPASTFTIRSFLQDVFLYVTRSEVARQIDEIIEARLTPEPTVVIGHSLGSVVAYNVIRRHRGDMDLRRFITVGSPLGLRAISGKLGPVENPAGPAGWYNAYDERDIVALNPLDDEFFPADPGIINNNQIDNRTENRHGILGYLNDRWVATQVADALL